MPGYLVDEGGERTHAVLPLDEYERLRSAEGRLESVRGFAMEMISSMDQDEQAEARKDAGEDAKPGSGGDGEGQKDRAWHQRT